MTDLNEIQDNLNLEEQDMKTIPSMLNVLTILTYVGCAFGALGSIYNYFTVCKSAQMLADKEMPEIGGTLGKMVDSAIQLSVKQCESRLVIIVSSLVSVILCFLGAMMMRQMKKQGFMVYVIGELVGPLSMSVILGGMAFGGFFAILGMIVPIVFVILYATQRKYLIN